MQVHTQQASNVSAETCLFNLTYTRVTLPFVAWVADRWWI